MPTKNTKPQTVSLEEASRLTGLHPETIKRYLRRGWLKGKKQGLALSAKWVVYRDSIDSYLANLPSEPDK